MAITSDNVSKKGPTKKDAVDAGIKATASTKKPIKDDTIDPAKELMEAVQKIHDSIDEMTGGQVLLKMERGNRSYMAPSGLKFTQEHPFQLVDKEDEELLLPRGFRRATSDEILEWYNSK